MVQYSAPFEDYQFLLHDLLKVGEHRDWPGFADLDADFTGDILRALGAFHENVMHPVNRIADEEGAHFENGQVQTPAVFKDLAAAYRESGWLGLGVSESLGGAGMPPVLTTALSEFSSSTCQSFRMYFSFCAPAAEMLNALADDWIKTHVVPRLVAGDWTATMAMTEAHCGTDLRQMRSRAVAGPDGTYRIRGSKMFISGGDNDLAENIAHIVLAKVPNEDGSVSDGLSDVNVFLVPKRQIDPETGALGQSNGVSVGSIEHKMGLAGSATCVMNFDDAVGYRIAATGRTGTAVNMAAMFFLMNYARVGVALAGVGYAEIAQQNAASYARERLSGRAVTGPHQPDAAADPIIVHPDIRRLLLSSRAFAEGGRALAAKVAFMQSVAKFSDDAAARDQAVDLMEVMTPTLKAYFTDKGFDATNDCLQVFGGHGYVAEHGMEHFVRNVRVGQLYEGANGIQAIDLVNRKLTARDGRAHKTFFDTIYAFVEEHANWPEMAEFTGPLAIALSRLETLVEQAREAGENDPVAPLSAAYDILTGFGIVAVGWTWAEVASLVLSRQAQHLTEEQGARKLALARVWMDREFPLLAAFQERAQGANGDLMALDAALI